MRHRTVCFRSSPQYLPDTVLPMPFPRSLTTTPFERSSTGRFEACSCKPTSGGRLPSSVQHHELALMFVTHTTASPSVSDASPDRAPGVRSSSNSERAQSSHPRSFPGRSGTLALVSAPTLARRCAPPTDAPPVSGGTCTPWSRPAPALAPDRCPQIPVMPPNHRALLPPPGPTS